MIASVLLIRRQMYRLSGDFLRTDYRSQAGTSFLGCESTTVRLIKRTRPDETPAIRITRETEMRRVSCIERGGELNTDERLLSERRSRTNHTWLVCLLPAVRLPLIFGLSPLSPLLPPFNLAADNVVTPLSVHMLKPFA